MNIMRKNALGSAAALLGLAAVLTGCHHDSSGQTGTGGSTTTTSTSGGGSALQIAVIPKGTSHEYWKSIHAGANKAAQDVGKRLAEGFVEGAAAHGGSVHTPAMPQAAAT